MTNTKFAQIMTSSGTCRPDEMKAAFFAATWRELSQGSVSAKWIGIDGYEGARQIAVLYPEDADIEEADDVHPDEFFLLHYTGVKRAVIEKRVWVLDTDPPSFVHRNVADIEDYLSKMNLYDSLSVLRELKEQYEHNE